VTAFVEFVAGDYQASDEALQLMHAQANRRGVKDVLLDRSEPFHVEALAALGELERAMQVLARLEDRGHTLPRPWIAVTLPRARALVLGAQGDPHGALSALDELEVTTAAQLPFEHAWNLLVRGQLLRRVRQRREAADTLAEAAAIFERLGSRSWAERARVEVDRVGLRPPAPDELTATELRVAQLAASGLTNREIAAAAFMSPKTVEANLARIYRKLEIGSRAELGAWIAANQRDASVQP
jgi:DNA-binding NarL/FixJ family response regulator